MHTSGMQLNNVSMFPIRTESVTHWERWPMLSSGTYTSKLYDNDVTKYSFENMWVPIYLF